MTNHNTRIDMIRGGSDNTRMDMIRGGSDNTRIEMIPVPGDYSTILFIKKRIPGQQLFKLYCRCNTMKYRNRKAGTGFPETVIPI